MKIKQSGIIGIDVGLASVTAVTTDRHGKIKSVGIVDISDSATYNTERGENLFLAIKQACDHAGVKGGACAITVSTPDVIVRKMQLPYMTEDAIMKNVRFEMEPLFQISSEDIVISYKLLNDYKSKLQRKISEPLEIMAVAFSRYLAEFGRKTVARCGLDLKFIDCDANAHEKLIRFLMSHGEKGLEHTVLINLRRSTANLMFFYKGRFHFSRFISTNFTGVAMDIINDPATYTGENSTFNAAACKSEIDKLVFEITNILEYEHYSGKRAQFTKTIFCGGFSQCAALQKYLSDELNMPVHPISHYLSSVYSESLPREYATLCTGAYAATLREVE